LFFVERFYLELVLEFCYFLSFAFTLRDCSKFLLETVINLTKILLFLLTAHKKDLRELRIAFLELQR